MPSNSCLFCKTTTEQTKARIAICPLCAAFLDGHQDDLSLQAIKTLVTQKKKRQDYYAANREKYKVAYRKKRKTKTWCNACNSCFWGNYLNKHKQSNMHKRNLEEQPELSREDKDLFFVMPKKALLTRKKELTEEDKETRVFQAWLE